MPQPASASVDVTTVRDRFNWDWATSDPVEGLDTYWWYAVSIRVDPAEVWAEDGEGDLWVVPFSTDGEDNVTFSDPNRSRLVAVPVATTDGAAATAVVDRRRQRALATNLDRPDKPGRESNAAVSERPNTEGITMDEPVRQILVGQGLDPDTANEEQVNAASVLAAASTLPPAVDADTSGDEGDETRPPGAEIETGSETEPPAADAPDAIDAQRDTELAAATARIAELERDRQTRETATTAARRNGLAAAWVDEGRIAPAERDHYRGLLDIDEDRTVALAASLAPNRIPVRERGSSGTAASQTPDSLTRALSMVPGARRHNQEVS